MPELLKVQAGADYFTQFHLTLQKPDLPQGIVDALNSQQQAAAQNAAQAQLNQKVNTELDSIRALVSVLGPQGYLTYKAIQEGKVTVVPIPQGSNVQVPAK
jgi:hypothetical protein